MLHELLRGLVAQSSGSDGGILASLVFPALIFGVFYFLIIRPQANQAKEQQSLLASLKKGDEVVTSGGVLGRIHAVSDKLVTLEIAKDVRIRVLKSSVQARAESLEADAAAKKEPAAEEKKEGK